MSVKRCLPLARVLLLLSVFLAGCCGPIKSFNDVDITPLFNTEVKILPGIDRISNIIDTEIFDSYDPIVGKGEWTSDGKHPDLAGIDVFFRLENELQTANSAFLWECERRWNTTKDFTFGGIEGNQYCISYVNELRDPPDAFCKPTGHYESFVVFQKGYMLITVLENSTDESSTAKDSAIELISKAIK
jgi:hypothetical protein